MRRRQRRDLKLERLQGLTGIRRRDQLIELGRLIDDVVVSDSGTNMLRDHFGSCHAIAVIDGAIRRDSLNIVHTSGEVFESFPYECVTSFGSVVGIAPASASSRLERLLRHLRESAGLEPGAAAVDGDALPVQIARLV